VIALNLRPAEPADLNMIKHDWFLSYRNNGTLQLLRPDVYQLGQNAVIKHLLETCPPIVATFPSVPDEVVGWVCRDVARGDLTHFVYVKHPYRRTGIATVLVAGTQQHTHETRAGCLLFQKVRSLFNPFLLYRGVP
jgi:GNAT superfamily N-acetyltransferase